MLKVEVTKKEVEKTKADLKERGLQTTDAVLLAKLSKAANIVEKPGMADAINVEYKTHLRKSQMGGQRIPTLFFKSDMAPERNEVMNIISNLTNPDIEEKLKIESRVLAKRFVGESMSLEEKTLLKRMCIEESKRSKYSFSKDEMQRLLKIFDIVILGEPIKSKKDNRKKNNRKKKLSSKETKTIQMEKEKMLERKFAGKTRYQGKRKRSRKR